MYLGSPHGSSRMQRAQSRRCALGPLRMAVWFSNRLEAYIVPTTCANTTLTQEPPVVFIANPPAHHHARGEPQTQRQTILTKLPFTDVSPLTRVEVARPLMLRRGKIYVVRGLNASTQVWTTGYCRIYTPFGMIMRWLIQKYKTVINHWLL